MGIRRSVCTWVFTSGAFHHGFAEDLQLPLNMEGNYNRMPMNTSLEQMSHL